MVAHLGTFWCIGDIFDLFYELLGTLGSTFREHFRVTFEGTFGCALGVLGVFFWEGVGSRFGYISEGFLGNYWNV